MENSENNYKVYAHIFPNGKIYIGITKQSLSARWGCKGSGYKGQPVYEAIEEFGWDNIEHVLVKDSLTKSEAQDKEKELIKEYNSQDEGYNVSDGGGCGSNHWCLFMYHGDELNSDEIALLSEDGITGHDITTRVRSRGWDLEKAMNTPKQIKGKKYEYNGELYTSNELAEISPVDGITVGDILNRINNHGWDVKRAVEQPKNIKLQPMGNNGYEYEYNGKMYKAYELAEMSSVDGMTVETMSHRLLSGWDIDRALNQPIKGRNVKYQYNGKEYTTSELVEISPVDGLTIHNITSRLREGWSIEDAVEKPKRKSPTNKK